MASAGMTLEDIFRAKYSLKKEDNLFQLIEAAMMVAVVEKKAEFHKRKGRIAQILNTERADDAVFLSPEDSDDDEPPQITPALAASAANQSSGECEPGSRANSENDLRTNKNSEKVIKGNNNKRHGIQEKQRLGEKGSNQEKKGSGIDDRKFEASERKLEQRYRDLEKKKRKIQVLEIKDAPKLENIGKVAKKIRF